MRLKIIVLVQYTDVIKRDIKIGVSTLAPIKRNCTNEKFYLKRYKILCG